MDKQKQTQQLDRVTMFKLGVAFKYHVFVFLDYKIMSLP
jgi:hypothetical protein